MAYASLSIEAHNTKPQNKNEFPIPFFLLISHITLILSAENRWIPGYHMHIGCNEKWLEML